MLEKDPSLGFQMLGYTVHPTWWILGWIPTLTDHKSHTCLQVFRSFLSHMQVPEVSYETWGLWRFPFWNQHKIKVKTVNIWILNSMGANSPSLSYDVDSCCSYPMIYGQAVISIDAGSLPSTHLQHPSLGQKDWLISLWSSLRNTHHTSIIPFRPMMIVILRHTIMPII